VNDTWILDSSKETVRTPLGILNNILTVEEDKEDSTEDWVDLGESVLSDDSDLLTTTPVTKTRRFLVGGNWKMNNINRETVDQVCGWLSEASLDPNTEVLVAVPGCFLDYSVSHLPSSISVAAQNCYKAETGAFTGELAPGMIRDCGAHWVILGHSERRTLFGETDSLVGEKVGFAVESGLSVIVCIGEREGEREEGRTREVVFHQLEAVARNVQDWSKVVIAYEPVWAIGTGKTATPEEAQEVHSAIRRWLWTNVSPAVAEATRILYGGSVTAENCGDLANCPDIDGSLVGGASLTREFLDIVNVLQ